MKTIVLAVAFVASLSGVAMAEPVKMTAAQMQSTAAGQLRFNVFSGNNSANVVATNLNGTSQTSAGIGLLGFGMALNGNATGQQNSVQILQR